MPDRQIEVPDECPACGLPLTRISREYSYANYACASGDSSHIYKYKWRIPEDPRIVRDKELRRKSREAHGS